MICYPLLGKNGEFGNQLFQIAATYSHAINCNTEAIFPSWEHNKIFKNKLNTFKILPKLENCYTEEKFYFTPIPKLPNLTLNGYFQSEKYFLNNKEKILKLFTFNDEFAEASNKKYLNILKDDPVGVQIRTYSRGSIDPRHIHCDVLENEEYLLKAFNTFGKDRTFIVTTDNLAYTEARLPKRKNIIINKMSSQYEDFYLLTTCKGIITSASSFGWWGAYLNKNKDKKIIMPKKWFYLKDGWYDTRDIYFNGVTVL